MINEINEDKINKDEVVCAIVNLLVLVFILIVVPVAIVIVQTAKSFNDELKTSSSTIQYLFNKQEYGGIRKC